MDQSKKLWGYRPQVIEYALAAGCAAMLATMALAIWRGREELTQLPLLYPLHFGTVAIVLVTTPLMLVRTKGDRLHRVLGYVWITCMVSTALITFFIRNLNDGGFSPIHLLSVLTLIVSAQIVASARKGDHVTHRKHVRGIILGALLIAGFFAFQFNRLFAIWIAS